MSSSIGRQCSPSSEYSNNEPSELVIQIVFDKGVWWHAFKCPGGSGFCRRKFSGTFIRPQIGTVVIEPFFFILPNFFFIVAPDSFLNFYLLPSHVGFSIARFGKDSNAGRHSALTPNRSTKIIRDIFS